MKEISSIKNKREISDLKLRIEEQTFEIEDLNSNILILNQRLKEKEDMIESLNLSLKTNSSSIQNSILKRQNSDESIKSYQPQNMKVNQKINQPTSRIKQPKSAINQDSTVFSLLRPSKIPAHKAPKSNTNILTTKNQNIIELDIEESDLDDNNNVFATQVPKKKSKNADNSNVFFIFIII